MEFELREHTADIAIEAHGSSRAEAFAAVADGMAAAQCDDIPAGVGEQVTIELTAENQEALLFDFLDELIYVRDVHNILPVDHTVTIEESTGEWSIKAIARGVPLSQLRAREVKAVTYSEMTVEKTNHGWRVYVVLDV